MRSATLARAARRCVCLLALLGSLPAPAAGLDALTSKDAAGGLRAALSQGIDRAVSQLGAADGFLGNPKVAIPLPPALARTDSALRLLGMGGDADALQAAMNHAAEAAVAAAGPTFKKALRSMTVTDAKQVLTGGEDAGTQYFRRTSADELKAKFRPIVAHATARLELASLYNRYAGKAAELGLISASDADINEYVTGRALDGLFSVIADEERAIRQDPLGQGSALIKKVFGVL